MSLIRTLVVDDSFVFLNSILSFLSAIPYLEVVGSARSGLEAIAQVEQLLPDLVVLDFEMPGMSGLEATRLLKLRDNAPRIIMLTMHDDSAYQELAMQAAADDFVSKWQSDTELVPAIDRLFDGSSD